MKIRFALAPSATPPRLDGLDAMLAVTESSGFDAIWLSDVALAPTADPLVGLAYAAGRTERLKLGANVVPLGHNPYLLAKALAQLDELSEGRLLLSFVPGLGMPEERAALGVEAQDRGALLEEMLELVRQLWAGKKVTHSRGNWSFEQIALPVRPMQDPLEVWLGGSGPKALERAGRLADGWLGALLTPSESKAALRTIQESAKRTGRGVDPEHFGMSIAYSKVAPDNAMLDGIKTRRPQLDPLEVVPVGVDRLRSLLNGYLDVGVSKFVLRPSHVDSWVDEVAWLEDAVLDMQT